MAKIQKNSERDVVIRCGECGQDISSSGVCERCDEICRNCDYKRRDHYHITDRFMICPRTVFEGTGNLRD